MCPVKISRTYSRIQRLFSACSISISTTTLVDAKISNRDFYWHVVVQWQCNYISTQYAAPFVMPALRLMRCFVLVMKATEMVKSWREKKKKIFCDRCILSARKPTERSQCQSRMIVLLNAFEMRANYRFLCCLFKSCNLVFCFCCCNFRGCNYDWRYFIFRLSCVAEWPLGSQSNMESTA